MNIFIIANPVASGGDAGQRAVRLGDILRNRGHHCEVYLTRFSGDAKQRISIIGGGIDRVVVVGGDGTFNEVLNGIPDDWGIPLAQLPTGNANLLGKDLNFPKGITEMADLLERGTVLKADLALMNNLRFIMVAGVGFDARVTEELKKVRKGRVNNLSYLVPALIALRDRPRFYNVVVDGKFHAIGAMVLVCNVRTYGGFCTPAFDAGIDTGVLDVLVLPGKHFFDLAMMLVHSAFGRITRMRGVHYLKGKQVTITAEDPIPVQLDGDFQGRYPAIGIDLQPGALSLLIP